MLNSLKQSFKITNKYIILATPLIFFSLLSSLYILFSAGGNIFSQTCAIALFIMMLTAFLSGWLYMIKLCINNSENEDPNTLIKEFPAGVGEYFLPVLGMVFNIIIISIIFFTGTYFIGMKLIGHVGISSASVNEILSSTEAMKNFMATLTNEQLIKLNNWSMLLMGTIILEYFVLMFQFPTLFYKCNNPYKSFYISLKDLFSKKFLKNILLFFLLFFSYFILSILSTILGANIITHFIITLINFYYLVFIAVLIFNYYYTNYVKIGGIIDKQI